MHCVSLFHISLSFPLYSSHQIVSSFLFSFTHDSVIYICLSINLSQSQSIYLLGESYLDVIQRLEPLVQEIERYKESLVIVGHQGTLKMLIAFYSGIDRDDAPHLEIKLNQLIALRPHSHG